MGKRLLAGMMAGALLLGGAASAWAASNDGRAVEIPPSRYAALDSVEALDGYVVDDSVPVSVSAEDVDLSSMGYEELLALKKRVDMAVGKHNVADKSPLLYEDDTLSIRYSGLELSQYSDSAYLKVSFLFENKTPNEVEVVCKNLIFNGCAVYLSKFVDIPGECVYIHEWTTDADTFLKYGLSPEDIDSISITFNVDDGESVRSDTAIIAK